MILYDLALGDKCTKALRKGDIWCTDGSFIRPSDFKDSGKVAYGYALNGDTVVSLKKSRGMGKWAVNGSYYNRPAMSLSMKDGVRNTEKIKKIERWESNYPSAFHTLNDSNAGIKPYMPAIDELVELYSSIMNGQMKDDLLTAGIYEECNYRDKSNDHYKGWFCMWSSTEGSNNPRREAWIIPYNGEVGEVPKDYTFNTISFYRFNNDFIRSSY